MSDPDTNAERLLARAEQVLARLEAWLPPAPATTDWQASVAFRYRRRGQAASIEPVRQVAAIALSDLHEVDAQKERLVRNTAQFVAGRGANNVLLTGARGTGKSSLVRACLQAFAPQGLRLVEVDKADLIDLPDIAGRVAGRPERFVVFCDDLSFDAGERGYTALKSVLDGSIAQACGNLLVYATSNRRHLLPETMQDNLAARHDDAGELHPGEATEEKVSLSERFGLWISFHPFGQREYQAIAAQWLRHHGVAEAAIPGALGESLVWALERGSRSGRVAEQFARDFAGRHPIPIPEPEDLPLSSHEPTAVRTPARTPVDVAVGVLIERKPDGTEGRFLLTSRPEGKPYAGYWEFPGGKLEAGETVEEALRRELHEELGIDIGAATPWKVELFDYPHALVRLHFCKVFDWRGDFEMRESQQMAWCALPVEVQPVLPGTVPVLQWFAEERSFEGPTHA